MAVIESTRVGGWTALTARIAGMPYGYRHFSIQLCHYTDPEDGSAWWLAMALEAPAVRRAPEERESRAEQPLRSAIQAAGMTVWEWDLLSNRILLYDWGHLFPVATGLPGNSSTGLPTKLSFEGFLDYVHEADAVLLRQAIDRALNQMSGFQLELRLALPYPEERWVCLSAGVVNATGKSGTTITGILYDTSPGKIRRRQMDEWVGIASHEIRTPVSSIKAYSQLLQEELGAGHPTEVGVQIVDRLVYQADRLSGLIRQLLDTTRIGEKQLVLEYRWMDWESMVQKCIDTVEPVGMGRIRFENGAAGRVYADPDRLQQACLNLMTNALKFSDADKPVIVRTSRAGAQVGFAVKDEGIGIPESIKENLFEPFMRGGPAGSGGDSGLGLGLYITAGIVRRHGGDIGVESRPGEGALFFFSIPAGGPAQP